MVKDPNVGCYHSYFIWPITLFILDRFWPNRYQLIGTIQGYQSVPVWTKSYQYEQSCNPIKVTMLTSSILIWRDMKRDTNLRDEPPYLKMAVITMCVILLVGIQGKLHLSVFNKVLTSLVPSSLAFLVPNFLMPSSCGSAIQSSLHPVGTKIWNEHCCC